MPQPRATYLPPPEDDELATLGGGQGEGQQVLPGNHLLDPTSLGNAFALLSSCQALRRDDLGELMARRYAMGALQVLWQIASGEEKDPETGVALVAPEVRRKAAVDLYQAAYGKPITVLRAANGGTGSPTIDGDIEKAISAAEQLQDLQAYMDLPPEQWPEHLRRAAMEALELESGKS